MTYSGKPLAGLAVGENKFQAVTTLEQIEDYGLIRPTCAAEATNKSDDKIRAAGEMHKEHQRRWDKARRLRADHYASYIYAVEEQGRPGGTPAITLFHASELPITNEGAIVPYSSLFTAIDGETQTEARFLLKESHPNTAHNPIAVTVYHGISPEAARQILHDYNAKAHPVTERETAAFNKTGALSIAINTALDKAGVHIDELNRRGAKKTKKTIVAHQQLLVCAAGYQLNGRGLSRNVSPGDLKGMNDMESISVPPTFSDQLAGILQQCRSNEVIGKAPPAVWQVAGVMLSRNRQHTQLDWDRAMTVYNKTAVPTQGGKRISVKERLSAIADVM